MPSKTLISVGLFVFVGWFASEACFPIYRNPVPVQIQPSPCPIGSNTPCPSPSPSPSP